MLNELNGPTFVPDALNKPKLSPLSYESVPIKSESNPHNKYIL